MNDFVERSVRSIRLVRSVRSVKSIRSIKDLAKCIIHMQAILIHIGRKQSHMLVWLGTSCLMQQWMVIQEKLIINGMV